MRWVRVASVLVILSMTCFHSIVWDAEARSDRRNVQGRDTDISGIFKTGDAKLDKILARYSMGKVFTAENLAIAIIRSTAPAEASSKYLSLDEALKSKLLTIKEISSGGSVPVLKAISHADVPIFLPFGSIVTGGKQDRMLREDVLLEAKETKDIGVYCIEQGRWSARRRGQSYFGSSSQVATQSMKSLGRASGSQVQIWSKVRERNYQFGSPSASSNVQANLRTAEFKKLAKKLKPVREGVAKQARVSGSLVILDGKVVGTEIFVGPAYFKKVWPQLFNSYVIDAASKKEIVKTDGDQARVLAENFLAEMSTAKVMEFREKGLTRFTIVSKNCQGHALIENRKGRLIYFCMFPQPEAVPSNMNRGQRQQSYPQGQPRSSRFESNMVRARPVPSRAAPRFTADNIAERVGSDRWNWTVFIKGNRHDIDAVKCVQYTLHPSFPNPVKLVCKSEDPNRAFNLSASGLGTFTIDIRLFMKDGSHKDLKHRLKF